MDNIQPDLSIENLLKNWPETIPVFTRHRMACIGCCMSCYETIASAAEIYSLPLPGFLDELNKAVATPGPET